MTGSVARTSHPFELHPHRTLVALSLPVMLSLVAEPLAGLVDTAFVERLGAAYAAALGAATALLSSFVWVFNFLGVGTQTEVARARGAGRDPDAREIATLALVLAAGIGLLAAGAAAVASGPAAAWMSDDPTVREATLTYLRIRLFGLPAALVLLAAFGALRGLQDMRSPMWIAGGMSLANVALDAVLIFGWGPVPAYGIAGAAWATTASQVVAAGAACVLVVRRLGWSRQVDWGRARSLFSVGRDMVIRTGSLLFFLLVSTRFAIQLGAEEGAAHQAIRQSFMLVAFLLDAYAASTQSLVAWFIGAGRTELGRRVAGVGLQWALVTGVALGALGMLAEPAVAALLVPATARAVFASSWPIFCLLQLPAAVSFQTDGVHWGTGDFAWLRNGMLVSTGVGLAGLAVTDPAARSLDVVWWVMGGWLSVRALFGLIRVWPGVGAAPLARADEAAA